MRFSRRTCAIASAAASLAIISTGCNTKVSQCNKLIKVANSATTELKAITQESGSGQEAKMAQMQRLADSLDKYSKEVQNVSLEDEQLQGFQKRLSTLYATSSEASQEIIAAAKAKNIKGMTAALKKLSGGSRTEGEIVSEMNGYCQNK
jgi:ABC-type transporter Mla subunit MlaD